MLCNCFLLGVPLQSVIVTKYQAMAFYFSCQNIDPVTAMYADTCSSMYNRETQYNLVPDIFLAIYIYIYRFLATAMVPNNKQLLI